MSEPERISTTAEFFENVVKLDVQDFRENPTSIRRAVHACTSLLSLRDWLRNKKEQQAHTKLGDRQHATWVTPSETTSFVSYQPKLNAINEHIGIVTDLANASKHMVLDPDRPQNTSLYGQANTALQTSGGALGAAPLGADALAGPGRKELMVKIGDKYFPVLASVNSAFDSWVDLMKRNL